MKRVGNGISGNSGGNATAYRKLTRRERRILVKNGNTAGDWNDLLVCDGFLATAVHRSAFYGENRIGSHTEKFLSSGELRLPVGISNSTIISCCIGNNAAIHNVRYLSGYLIGESVMLFNIDEMTAPERGTSDADLEKELIWIAVANENGGRQIGSFAGMTAADAYLWSRNRDRSLFQKSLLKMTVKASREGVGLGGGGARIEDAARTEGDASGKGAASDARARVAHVAAGAGELARANETRRRGNAGCAAYARAAQAGAGCRVGDNSVLRSCRIVEEVQIGEWAHISGANFLKKLTVRSSAAAPTIIGEGTGLENGHIDLGCKILSGAKANNFCIGTNATLDLGARFIDSVLGDNSKISCCEVVSSLLFPFHEQHHNNSFLIAATIQGQCNVGAGATMGSNHNSRAPDSELSAGRGFWPGLCVNLKNPTKIASYCLVAKGSYHAEMHVPLPFTLISNDEKENKLQLYPGYWFLHNMYALVRNSWKLPDRDAKLNEWQQHEYDYLAPDTVEEVFTGLEILEQWIDRYSEGKERPQERMHIEPDGIERSSRGVVVLHVQSGYNAYKEIIHYYGIRTLLHYMRDNNCESFSALKDALGSVKRESWLNLGGQIFKKSDYQQIIANIEDGSISTWAELHRFYKRKADEYPLDKARHALASLLSLHKTDIALLTAGLWKEWIEAGVELQNEILSRTVRSRRKDYQNEFRRMMYDCDADMNEVVGDPDDNLCIKALEEETKELRRLAERFQN